VIGKKIRKNPLIRGLLARKGIAPVLKKIEPETPFLVWWQQEERHAGIPQTQLG
jgi:hypothetical protein